MTLGAHGAVLASDGHVKRVEPQEVGVVDTVGAGDSFLAALLAAVRERGWNQPFDGVGLVEVGMFAMSAAGVTVSRAGAEPPWRSEMSQPEPG